MQQAKKVVVRETQTFDVDCPEISQLWEVYDLVSKAHKDNPVAKTLLRMLKAAIIDCDPKDNNDA